MHLCVCVAEEDTCKLESPDMAQGGFPLIDTYKAENFLFDLMTLSLQGMFFVFLTQWKYFSRSDLVLLSVSLWLLCDSLIL